MASSNYRQKFVRAFPGIRIPGQPGYWYRCNNCGNWCARPGNSGYIFPDYMKMEVDHIVPWSLGGTDTLDNLQALCKPCNRAKGNGMSASELNYAAALANSKGRQFRFKKRRKARKSYM